MSKEIYCEGWVENKEIYCEASLGQTVKEIVGPTETGVFDISENGTYVYNVTELATAIVNVGTPVFEPAEGRYF